MLFAFKKENWVEVPIPQNMDFYKNYSIKYYQIQNQEHMTLL